MFGLVLESISLIIEKKFNRPKDKHLFSIANIQNQVIKVRTKQRRTIPLWGYIIIAFLSSLENALFYKIANIQTYGISAPISLLGLIITLVLSYFILKTKLYRHHIVSLIMIAVITTLYYISDIGNVTQGIGWQFSSYSVFAIHVSLYLIVTSFKEVYEHYLMRFKFTSPSKLLFIEGTSSMILLTLYSIIINHIPCNSEGFFGSVCSTSKWNVFKLEFTSLFNYSSIATLYFWLYIVLCFGMNYFRILTNKRLSPTHKYMAEMVFVFYWYIHDVFLYYIEWKGAMYRIYVRLLNSILLIIPIFIFNEYLILNFCGLGKNTYKEIDKRSGIEMNSFTREIETLDELFVNVVSE